MDNRTPRRDRSVGEQERWFVAIVPPDGVGDRVTALKQDCADRFGTRQALKSPPHITLIPPFERSMAAVKPIRQVLADFARERSPFALRLDGFGAFVPRVLFLRPAANPSLEILRADLADRCQTDCQIPRETRPFHAHMTVAFRDWEPAQFHAAWAEFGDCPFLADFMVDHIVLLCHRDRCWQIDQAFRLSSDLVGPDHHPDTPARAVTP
ncbi:MAG: 2'-5' RNA ligase family protein [Oscillatoriales cyanobacterium]|nr:MAG: 2'-5' RNA ligase family protein [Oscillatoriales cyanobacterium]